MLSENYKGKNQNNIQTNFGEKIHTFKLNKNQKLNTQVLKTFKNATHLTINVLSFDNKGLVIFKAFEKLGKEDNFGVRKYIRIKRGKNMAAGQVSNEEDEFYGIRTAYFTGNFEGVLKEAKNLKSVKGIRMKERDAYVACALIAQKKYKQAQQVIGDNVATPLLAVKQLLAYRQAASSEEKELVIDTLKGFQADEESVTDNVLFCVACAQVFIEDNKLKDALVLVNKDNSLELYSLNKQKKYIYILCI
ncbi:hypothetical protein RFI_07708 [Reticulomyxa filosa]|uniref:Uncharacterized protein n=1 Tax=Reticulomyxa filosa TaxID=46433 RepID=X6NTW1_RETFI|nr:hypothetical protein RFI_07708 [Reticulomyxa filosa]|eukprot:ETO29411.1 hypothetical protein RFI_07708 [Reticulomyxa filosa]